MKTIAVVALKGGTGKTTVCVNLAARAHHAGLKVMLADLDPQASCGDWSKARQAAGPIVAPLKVGSLFPAQYTAQNAKYDLMLIDTRASSQVDAVAAVKSADFSLIVVRPTVIDLRAIAATVELLRPLRRPAAFVINQAPSQRVGRDPVIVMEAIELLMSYGLTVAPVGIRARQVYQTTFSQGRTPYEDEPSSPAGVETDRLWDFTVAKLWPHDQSLRTARTIDSVSAVVRAGIAPPPPAANTDLEPRGEGLSRQHVVIAGPWTHDRELVAANQHLGNQ